MDFDVEKQALKLKAGVYDLTEAEYHADPCQKPSLSKSIAQKMLAQTPRHGWLGHPRLNPGFKREDKRTFNIGGAAHAKLLEGRSKWVSVNFPDYKKAGAKLARDATYEAGNIPLLPHEQTDVEMMVSVARSQLAHHEEAFDAFTDGKPEQTLIWEEEGGIWCRARLDWKPNKSSIFDEYKTTTSAHPDDWQRRVWDLGHDLQAAFYLRGIKALGLCKDPIFRFIVQEVKAPYALSVIGLTPVALVLAELKVWRALSMWRWCLQHNCWPGYPNQTCYIDPPPWEITKAEELKARDEIAREAGVVHLETHMNWQAPLEEKPAKDQPAKKDKET